MDSSEERKYKIVIADDHEIVRIGLSTLFELESKFILVGSAENGLELLELIKIKNPDVALVDILMPGLDGIETTRLIKASYPNVKTVILTSYEDSINIENALSAGADGYLSKNVNPKELLDALNNVFLGERVFSKSVLMKIENKSVSYQAYQSTPIAMSKREQEILGLVAEGLSSKEIGDKLFISIRTVESHRNNLMQKLGVKRNVDLVRYAIINKHYL